MSCDARGPVELTALTGLSGDASNWPSNDARGPVEFTVLTGLSGDVLHPSSRVETRQTINYQFTSMNHSKSRIFIIFLLPFSLAARVVSLDKCMHEYR